MRLDDLDILSVLLFVILFEHVVVSLIQLLVGSYETFVIVITSSFFPPQPAVPIASTAAMS